MALTNTIGITMSLLSQFAAEKPCAQVKVGTIISKVNADDVLNIGEILFESENILHPDTWRLYQFSPLGDGIATRSIHEIPTERFFEICQSVVERFPKAHIAPLSHADSNDSYIFINPDLKFIVLSGDQYIEVGDAYLMDVEDIRDLKKRLSKVTLQSTRNRSWLWGITQ